MKSQRLAPLSGIVFVVLVLVGILAVGGSTPDSSDSPAKITSFYVDHHDKQFVAAALVAIGTLFLAIWVGSLRERLRGGGEVWSNVALIGGAAAVAGFLFAVVVHIALADGGNQNFSADAMVALNGLDSNDFFAFALPLGIMLLGAAGGALKTGALPRWLAWVALVLGIASFTPAVLCLLAGRSLGHRGEHRDVTVRGARRTGGHHLVVA